MIPLGVLAGSRHVAPPAGGTLAGQPVQFYNIGDPASYPGTGNTVYDLSGSGDHATVYGAPTYSASGGYFQMDINDSFGSSSIPYTTAFTATVVFYLNSYRSLGLFQNSLIASSAGIGGSGDRGSWVYLSTKGALIVEAFNGRVNYTSADWVIGLNQWVAVTMAAQKGAASSVYINGSKHIDITAGTLPAQKITFGDLRPDRGLGIDGRMSAGVVYDYLVPESDVLNNHDLLLNQVGA